MTEKVLLSIEQVDEVSTALKPSILYLLKLNNDVHDTDHIPYLSFKQASRGDTDFLLCHLSSQDLLQHKDTLGALLVRTEILVWKPLLPCTVPLVAPKITLMYYLTTNRTDWQILTVYMPSM